MIGQRVPGIWIGSDEARRDFSWTPVAPRPDSNTRAAKADRLRDIEAEWESLDAWVAHHIFGSPFTRSPANGKQDARMPDTGVVLCPNSFPYQCPIGTVHSVLWMATSLPPASITAILRERLPSDDFVWYYNPKQSAKTTHVQVFHRPHPPGMSAIRSRALPSTGE